MQRIIWSRLTPKQRDAALRRPEERVDAKLLNSVRGIVEDVRARGWAAVEHYSKWIDGAEPTLVKVADHAAKARAELDPRLIEAIEGAAANIRAFHEATLPTDISVETLPGVTVSKVWRPVDRVGIYVPGGSAPLLSTLLMLAIPARVAGAGTLTVVTPPRADDLHPAIALAAELSGIEHVWSLGGAHSIAALAFGAGEIERTDLICGPGNAWVAAAKAFVSSLPGGPRIDLPAGPSELMVVADETADARLVAADLLSQAEHDRSAQVILVTASPRFAKLVADEIELQLFMLPRAKIARASLEKGRTIIVDDLDEAIDVVNSYAPEHLSLALEPPQELVPRIRNAGAIFAGGFAAETFGDYLAGSSHVLPTDGAARAWGGVSTQTFMKAMTVQSLSGEAVQRLAPAAALLARAEGLEAHARAADARLGEPA